MGIFLLSKFLSKSPIRDSDSVVDQQLPTDSTLVVDAANFMNKACYSTSLSEICAHLNGNYANFAEVVEEIVLNFVDNLGLNLIFVFETQSVSQAEEEKDEDGEIAANAETLPTGGGGVYLSQSELKAQTTEGRRDDRRSAWNYFEDFCSRSSRYPTKELPMPPLVSETFKQTVMRLSEQRRGKIFIEYPNADDQDADYCIARICRRGNEGCDQRLDKRPTHYCYSDDTDFLVMAGICPLIFISPDALTGDKFTGARAKRVWSREVLSSFLFDPNDEVFSSLYEGFHTSIY